MLERSTAAAIGCFALAACATPQTNASPAPASDARWVLVWSDEFDGDTLDRSKWKPEESCWGGGNDERQCYTDRTANVEVSGGMLRLKARKEAFTGPDRPPEIAANPNPMTSREYTSGKVRTRGLHAWKYGKVEFRAKLPPGQGTWSAFWMMQDKNLYGGWPLSGEIDILEGVNLGASCSECEGGIGENRVISALHFGAPPPENDLVDTRTVLPSLALPSDDFHVWTLEWGEGLMRFYLDGRQYWELTEDDWYTTSPKAKGRKFAPFDQPFYIMANLAVGGRLSEENNDIGFDEATFPTEFVIDWVRVHQCEGDRDTGLACMTKPAN